MRELGAGGVTRMPVQWNWGAWYPRRDRLPPILCVSQAYLRRQLWVEMRAIRRMAENTSCCSPPVTPLSAGWQEAGVHGSRAYGLIWSAG